MNFELMVESLPALLSATVTTIELLVASLFCGMAVALPVAILRVSGPAPVRLLLHWYIYFFRGTPLLVQIFLVYYGLAQLEVVRDSFLWPYLRQAWVCAILTFSLNTAAYTAYILRGAIEAVPAGEIEAARACGMSTALTYRTTILPGAFRIALPAYGNEVVSMLKSTSLASTITVMELTGAANTIVARTFAPYELFITAALIYLTITYVLTTALRALEYRLSRHTRPLGEPATPLIEGADNAGI
ncbi:MULTISPECIES: ABC transporter permease [unclassified Mesorhizobium]|uniref:ABC transporter permease n=1 Tax=unclassified Mesorhizobium TaxID=325217 RepID=UPI00112AE0FA|nr:MULTISPECIES: ABC transporter permease [unclassified Mesorhizobium]TPJ40691.1 ABC transporter permease [Mesorhizobium sp. B2-6-6]MCA0000209.1 ABC transporter permease [Mesorhizobium sp. B264B2A]MCA0006261.1 ABC transporter permease [Mesorhizobium sp. B264B1B]MCA0017851.1 ABC transporter permease [Mesorhizobium sp. B264B1A]TPJ64337.1 ABC transporter permease [Mesorhizobium sp. B2-6-1]